ncbi:MAG: hypothetical protein R3F46_03595 [bacterium]
MMKYFHGFVIQVNPTLLIELNKLGFDVEIGWEQIRIAESDSRLSDILNIVANPDYSDLIEHYFMIDPSPLDLIESSSLILIPKALVDCIPFDGLKYLEECFDTTNACPPDPGNQEKKLKEECGLGFVQTKPLKLKTSRFANRKHHLYTLNDMGDGIFVSVELYDKVFMQLGLDFWPVLDYRTGNPSDRFVQLRIIDEVELDVSDCTPTVCSVCKRTKYKPLMGWYAPRPLSHGLSICKSVQKFGMGFDAYSLVIVDSKLYANLREFGLSHNIFWPCADENTRYPLAML